MSRFTIGDPVQRNGGVIDQPGRAGKAHLFAREEADEDRTVARLPVEVLLQALGRDQHRGIA